MYITYKTYNILLATSTVPLAMAAVASRPRTPVLPRDHPRTRRIYLPVTDNL